MSIRVPSSLRSNKKIPRVTVTKQCSGCLSPQRESKIVFILDCTPWIPDSRYWIPLSVSETWILGSGIVTGILDSLCCIPNSTSKIFPDYRFQIPKGFPNFLMGRCLSAVCRKTKIICTETRRVSRKHDFSSYNIYKEQ